MAYLAEGIIQLLCFGIVYNSDIFMQHNVATYLLVQEARTVIGCHGVACSTQYPFYTNWLSELTSSVGMRSDRSDLYTFQKHLGFVQ